MKKLFSILFATVLALSLVLVPAVVSAAPGSYTTSEGLACWSYSVTLTDSPLSWSPLEVDVSYADGKATFVITAPVAFNPEAPNDNFWLILDPNNNGLDDGDFQVLYNTRLPSEDPNQTYDFHWAKKTYNGGWSDYQEVPGDWDVSETGLSEFTVTIPVSHLGGANSNYGFQIGLVKYVHMDVWDDSWPTIPWDPPTCGPWSTQALIYVPLPSEGWESETIPPNTVVGLTGEIEQITAINVDPTSIDFGSVTPGNPVSGDDITVENIGTVTVVVDATVDPVTGVFKYLRLGGAYSPGYSGLWDDIISGLLPSKNKVFTTELDVPSTYSALGEETATLIFEATASP